MKYTLKEVLKLDTLKDAIIRTKNHDLTAEVRGINIMEAPDVAQWIEGHEIILTNLFSVYSDEAQMRYLIQSLWEKHVAALLVKTKRFVDSVPPCILEEADKYGLAVIEIPVNVRYMNIMYPVLAAVFDNQVMHLSYFKKTYHQLTALALEKSGLDEITNAVASIIHNPAVLYDQDFQVMWASNENYGQITESTYDSEHFYENLYYYCNNVKTMQGGDQVYKQIVIPIKIFDITRANLAVIEETPLYTLDFIALQNAVTVLCLEILSNFTLAETERKYKMEILDDIVAGRYSSLKTLEQRASIIDWNLNLPYCVILAEFFDAENNGEGEHPPFDPIFIEKNTTRVSKVIDGVMNSKGLKGITGIKRNLVILFLENDTAIDGEYPENPSLFQNKATTFCTALIEQITRDHPGLSMNIGYSTKSGRLQDIPEIYQAAQDALTIGCSLYGTNFQCNYETLGVFKLLCSAHDREKLKTFIPPSLQMLYDYDSKKPSGELLKTFALFLENGCNANKTAKDMFIHYKTLHYRLQKIQQITNIDLKNNEELLELQIGIKIMQVLNDVYTFAK